MGIFKKAKENEYLTNMQAASRMSLSLLETMEKMQMEYEKLEEENLRLKTEIVKAKERR